jgi:hypothetical protein
LFNTTLKASKEKKNEKESAFLTIKSPEVSL